MAIIIALHIIPIAAAVNVVADVVVIIRDTRVVVGGWSRRRGLLLKVGIHGHPLQMVCHVLQSKSSSS